MFNLIKFFFQIFRSCYQASSIIKKINPDIILGMGGYISFPGGLVSILYKKPLLIHEQNRTMGLSNKILSKFSTRVMQAFPKTALNAETVGNPLRKKIMDLPNPMSRFKYRIGPLKILILGGSQGANILNITFPKIAYTLKNKIIIWHQAGKNNIIKTLKNYKKFEIHPYKITDFIKNMAEAYSWADMVVCRSGALTVSEIEYIGLPAIFIPFPHRNKHQYWNAYPLQIKGGAIIVEQNCLLKNKIIKILEKITRKKLIIMAKKIYSKHKNNPTKTITTIIENTNNIN
nr:undecaprenyldiphospho-muramoylpentapeptide beta-N-acetylglucosaminyltransferase [Buchnera aphidicola]